MLGLCSEGIEFVPENDFTFHDESEFMLMKSVRRGNQDGCARQNETESQRYKILQEIETQALDTRSFGGSSWVRPELIFRT